MVTRGIALKHVPNLIVSVNVEPPSSLNKQLLWGLVAAGVLLGLVIIASVVYVLRKRVSRNQPTSDKNINEGAQEPSAPPENALP